MQQHLMQMQPMMAGYTPTNVTTDHIQQILENQNCGKMSECAENQARLQRNLMYLAAIADSQPQQSSVHTQFPSAVAQPGANYMQHQQAQSMPAQSIMTSRSSTIYSQQTLSAMQQHQALHNQLGVSSGGSNTGLHMFHNESGMAGGNPTIGSIRLSNFGRSKTSEDFQGGNRGTTVSSAGSGEGRTGHSGGQGGESIYSEEGEEESN